MVVTYQMPMTFAFSPAAASWTSMSVAAEATTFSALPYDNYVSATTSVDNPFISGDRHVALRAPRDDSEWLDATKTGAASATFTATTLMASGALAMMGCEVDNATLSSLIMMVVIVLSIATVVVGPPLYFQHLAPFLDKIRYAKHAKQIARQATQHLTHVFITINDKRYPDFDSAYAEGNKKLNLKSFGVKGVRNLLIGGAIASLAGGIYLLKNFGSDTFLGHLDPATLIVGGMMGGIAGGAFTHFLHVEAYKGFFTRKYLEKRGKNGYYAPEPILGKLPVVKTTDIAKWYNALYAEAEALSKGYIRDSRNFCDILNSGRHVVDTSNNRELNFVELMGDKLIWPFVKLASESPIGAVIFNWLAKENAAARAFDEDKNLMKERTVSWNYGDLSHLNALFAMLWLARHGNTSIVEFVRSRAEGKCQEAVTLWNDYQKAMANPVPAAEEQAKTANPIIPPSPPLEKGGQGGFDTERPPATVAEVSPEIPASSALEKGSEGGFDTDFDKIVGGFLGQPHAIEWLEEMNALLRVEQARQKKGGTRRTVLHTAITGKDGTGRHALAEIYKDILHHTGRLKNPNITEVDSKPLLEKDWQNLFRDDTVIVFDLANFCTTCKTSLQNRMREVADLLENRPDIVTVFIGDENTVQSFLSDHPKMAELIKQRVRLQELEGESLAKILLSMAEKDGFELAENAKAKVERVLKDKRGGAEVARELLDKAIRHQAIRLVPEVKKREVDEARLTVLEAADFANGSAKIETTALDKLEAMVGLEEAKESLRRILAMVRQNREREEQGLNPEKPSLHALFVGNQGTGKTSIAKIFADALKEMGYSSKGTFVVTNPSEIVGSVLGETERKTLAKLEEARGGVLFMDEAHNLALGGHSGGKSGSVSNTGDFRLTALKTIMSYMEDHRDDIVVIFAGYPKEIEELLNSDPGLRRRFNEIVIFRDYTLEQLGEILDKLVASKDFVMEPSARKAAMEILGRQLKAKDFGFAGAVRNLFEAGYLRQSRRLQEMRKTGAAPSKDDIQRLTEADFEGASAPDPEAALKELESFIGLRKVKEQFRELMALVRFAEKRGADPWQGMEPYFLFGGPPGTGKTSVAGILGKMFKGLGLLPSDKVVTVNALDLMAGFTGQTASKTQDIFESALGGVLLIDEIGILANTAGGFSDDVVTKLLTLLEKYRGRLVVVGADYDDRINAFLKLNEGLQRRFGKRFSFDSLSADDATELYTQRIKEARPNLALSDEAISGLPELMQALHSAPGWASGGDVRTLINETILKQASYWARNQGADANLIPLSVLREAVMALIGKKEKDFGPALRRRRSLFDPPAATQEASAEKPAPATVATATAQAAQASAVEATAAHQHSADCGCGHKVNVALGLQIEATVNALGLAPEIALEQMKSGDPNSALAREIAEKTGQQPEEVAQELQEHATQVQSQDKEVGWVCMYCGNSNPQCPYKGRPDRERFNALTLRQ